ncbi:MAG: PQQ-dependent sugar dehydrogenase, partial [Saprospiraceae bacterium]
QGGLLDVATHPDFAKNQIIYLTYSKFRDSADIKLSTTALFKAKLDGNTLKDGKDIFVAIPYQLTRIHYGSRIDFDKEGHIFLTVGDRFQHLDTLPQKLNVDMGKVHRLNDDGSIPKDNPFVDVPGAHGSIWSIGHRNLQGLYINPADGTVWENEHGPRGGDEVNIIEKGKNYGWPLVSYGINYNGKIMTPFTTKEGMEQPKVKWVPSIGPSGMTIVSGDKYPAWKGDLLVGSLRFKYLDRIHLEGTTPGAEEPLLKNLGRMRFVKMGPDGYIYVGVETPGFIFKLEPVNAQ